MRSNIFYSVIGGVILLIATVTMSAFVSSPPSRAEFTEIKVNQMYLIKSVNKLEAGQKKILERLIR